MKKYYKLLIEAETIAPPSVNQTQTPPNGKQKQPTRPTATMPSLYVNFNQIFKPFKASSLPMMGRDQTMKNAKVKLYQINHINRVLKTKVAASSSVNPKDTWKYQLQLKYCVLCYRVHHEYISKSMFFTSKIGGGMNDPRAQRLNEEYTRKLFMYEEAYLRETQKLDIAPTEGY